MSFNFIVKIRENWNNQRLQTKLVTVFSTTLGMMLFINLIMYYNINNMINRVDSIYISNVTLNELSNELEQVQTSMREYLDTKSSEALDSYYRNEQDYRKLTELLNDTVSDNALLIMEKNIKSLSDDYMSIVDNTIVAKRGRDVEKYKALYNEAEEKCQVINTFIYSLNNEQFQSNNRNYQIMLDSLHILEVVNSIALFGTGFVAIFFVIMLTTNLTRPLRNLSEAANEVAQGNFEIEVPETENADEVGVLSRTFNQMIHSIQRYIEQIRENMVKESAMKERELMMEGHLKDAQLKYLQAQINPHFLFNTLNAGAQLAMMEDADRTCSFIQNMADFFRYNIKKIDEDTTIGEELRLVDSYIYILNVRFSGEIHYQKQIDDSLNDIAVPSMILQPIVENAVNYGIRGIDHEGIIEVSVYREEDSVFISVWDNGNGMTQERIDEVLTGMIHQEEELTNSNGIGLGNVIKRLNLYFGISDVMQIKSDGPGFGTEVIMEIPWKAIKKKD